MALAIADVVGAGAVIGVFVFSMIAVLIILEREEKAPTEAPPRTDSAWPFRLALSAALLGVLIAFVGLWAYGDWAPTAVRGDCQGKTGGAEFWSWVVFADAVALFLGVTFVVATRLRINRLGTIGLTVGVMSPVVIVFAFVLDVINRHPFC